MLKCSVFILLLTLLLSAQRVATGTYIGNGSSLAIPVGFQPSMVITVSPSRIGVFKTTQHGTDSSSYFTATADSKTEITALTATGFTVGAGTNANPSGGRVRWTAFAGPKITFLKYKGNGVDNRDIATTVTPIVVLIKSISTREVRWRCDKHTGDQSSSLNVGGSFADNIQAFGTNSFQIGANPNVNTAGVWHRAIIFAASDSIETFSASGNGGGTVPITLTSALRSVVSIGSGTGANTHGWIQTKTFPQDTSYSFSSSAAPATTRFLNTGTTLLSRGAGFNINGQTSHFVFFLDQWPPVKRNPGMGNFHKRTREYKGFKQ